MATQPLSNVVRQLRRASDPLDLAGLTDGQLLGRFVADRAEAAFAELLRRHGPMVWGVCRRVLGAGPDAEDAFQAAFLVLVRRAADVVPRDLVANWLYGVAHQTALKARATAARRREREKQVVAIPEPAVSDRDGDGDLRSLLDRELSRLPDRYREAVVLCDLEGMTRPDVARQLGLPEGTVASRVARARALLAKRLARHGLPVTAGALAATLANEAAAVPSAVPAAALKSAARLAAGEASAISANVLALMEGARHTMRHTYLKLAGALAATLLVVGLGLPRQPEPRPAPPAAAKAADPPAAKSDPRYCRLVFGPSGKLRPLVRLDGDAIAIDRNGDGKFDGKGERFQSLKDCKNVALADPDGKTSYLITQVDDLKVVPPERFIEVRVQVKGPVEYPQACIVGTSPQAEFATEARLHGPLTVAAKTWRIANRATRAVENPLVDLKGLVPGPIKQLAGKGLSTESTLPAALKREAATELTVAVITEGPNSWSCICSPDPTPDGRREKAPFPKGVHPVADVEFPATKPGDPPIKQRFALDQFVTDGGFSGPVTVPAGAGAGTAKVTFSFAAWKGANVAPTTVEIPLAEPAEKPGQD